MKLTIEGTQKDIEGMIEWLYGEEEPNLVPNPTMNVTFGKYQVTEEAVEEPDDKPDCESCEDKNNCKQYTINTIKRLQHYSINKKEWIPVNEMNQHYLINALAKLIRESKSRATLINNGMFISYILNLYDAILEEL